MPLGVVTRRQAGIAVHCKGIQWPPAQREPTILERHRKRTGPERSIPSREALDELRLDGSHSPAVTTRKRWAVAGSQSPKEGKLFGLEGFVHKPAAGIVDLWLG